MALTNRVLVDYYRCPSYVQGFTTNGELPEEHGYFRLGSDTICYGRLSCGPTSRTPVEDLHDASKAVEPNGAGIHLPFDAAQVIDDLRCERYAGTFPDRGVLPEIVRKAYYFVRPVLPISVRKIGQQIRLSDWDKISFPAWPVDATVDRIHEKLMVLALKSQGLKEIPFIWFWPDGFPSCAVMTHDVETTSGRDFCTRLMNVDDSFGIRSAFQVVPEQRYRVPQQYLDTIQERGFEINVHDLNHDGHLFADRAQFLERVAHINAYGARYGARGFRSASLYRNVDWYDALNFSYDMSVPNVAHLDPQRGGCCTVMPYFIGKILELPVTTTQDYSLFHILGDYSIELWKRQTDLILKQHGLMSFVIHPDYLIPKRALATYLALLRHIVQLRSEGKIWLTLPAEVDTWWRQRSAMSLTFSDGDWRIEGEGSNRAQLAYARLEGDTLVYRVSGPQSVPGECGPQLVRRFQARG